MISKIGFLLTACSTLYNQFKIPFKLREYVKKWGVGIIFLVGPQPRVIGVPTLLLTLNTTTL